MGAGSQNRNTKKAISHLETSQNLKQVCKCLLHARSDTEGTSIERTKFNRQGDGIQSMCSQGKTIIDVVKHQLWRTIDIILLTGINEFNLYNKEYNNILNIDFLIKYGIDKIIISIFDSENSYIASFINALNNNQMTAKIYFETSQYLEENLKLKKLGFYKIYFDDEITSIKEYNDFQKSFKSFTAVEKYKPLEYILRDLLANDFDNSYYIKETSQEGVFYDASMIAFNWSKKNNLYKKVGEEYILTNYRGPFHNTKQKAVGTTSRNIKFLVETNEDKGFKEVNSYIKSIRKPNHEADHIWPLALGGKHTIENIVSLPEKENLLKKDHITFKAYSLLVDKWENTVEMISGDFLPVISKYHKKIKKDETLFSEHVKQFELELKLLMQKRLDAFEKMTQKEKIYFLKEMRKDLINSDKALKFIERFERNKQNKDKL